MTAAHPDPDDLEAVLLANADLASERDSAHVPESSTAFREELAVLKAHAVPEQLEALMAIEFELSRAPTRREPSLLQHLAEAAEPFARHNASTVWIDLRVRTAEVTRLRRALALARFHQDTVPGGGS